MDHVLTCRPSTWSTFEILQGYYVVLSITSFMGTMIIIIGQLSLKKVLQV